MTEESALSRIHQDNALQYFAQRDKSPQGNEQSAGERHDHGLGFLPSGNAGLISLHETAVRLMLPETPSQLDQGATDPRVARFGEALLVTSRAAFIGCTG
jgi:hypothetical protein